MPAHSPQITETKKEGSSRKEVLQTEFFLRRLAEQLRKLGMSISFWDSNGSILTTPSFQGQFCCLMCGQKGVCLEALSEIAGKVSREGRREITTSPNGCRIFSAPMYQRRRLTGAVVACFPTLQTIESEQFLRTCSRTHLDTEAMASLCRREAVYTDRQAENMCSILEWIIQSEQAREVSREELAALSSNLANTYEELSLLYSISGSMKVTRGAKGFFENLCNELLEVMHVQTAAVVLHPRSCQDQPNRNSESGDRVVIAGKLPLTKEQLIGISQWYIAPQATKHRSTDSAAGNEGGNIFSTIVDNRFFRHAEHLGPDIERIRTLAAAPLTIAGRYRGVVIAANKVNGEFDSADLKLISAISGQAAVFLENHDLYEDVQDLLMGVLHALTASIDAKDPYTCGHSHRVAIISRKLAQLSGFDENRVGRIYLAGLLHDIGKIGVSETVLQKSGVLTGPEFESMRRHPGIGATILGGIRQMKDLIPVLLHHHERPDGGGYPAGLSAGEIPVEALIVGLADSLDAMTSSRTYRNAMPLEVVITEIRQCSGTQFDPRLTELLLSLNLEDFLTQIRTAAMNDSKTFERLPVSSLCSTKELSQNAD
ncbi:MAG: HD domain-containing protein [Planctomycetota bacterium]|nr:HD domain-containing protein [Planctomycetota bacterium]